MFIPLSSKVVTRYDKKLKKAITDDLSGVTRDRQYGMGEWNGKIFNLVDTGGFVPNSKDVFERAIKDQVKIAIQEANLLIFMVDVTTGITDLDEAMAIIPHRLRKFRSCPRQNQQGNHKRRRYSYRRFDIR